MWKDVEKIGILYCPIYHNFLCDDAVFLMWQQLHPMGELWPLVASFGQ